MAESLAKTITVSKDMHLAYPAGVIWPLLCPVREYDWIETWDCEMVRTDSGVNELDCVFVTDFPTECGPELWVTTRYEPYSRLEFIRSNAARVIRLAIELLPEEGGTRLIWSQHVTSLNKDGDEYIDGKTESFAGQIAAVEKLLAHYLETGSRLEGEDAGLITESKEHVHSGKIG